MEELTHRLIEFYERLSSWEHAVVRGKGLTLPQMHTIEILGVHQGLRMKELAQKMGVTTGTLTVLVDRLVDKGLVARTPHETDRRSYVVALTPKGAARFAEHHTLHLALTAELAAALGPDDAQGFSEMLRKVLERF
ncbi:MAG: MarR family winged helix-turn-helix transcriptional regulator [Desulfovibrionaceae bacterium]